MCSTHVCELSREQEMPNVNLKMINNYEDEEAKGLKKLTGQVRCKQ